MDILDYICNHFDTLGSKNRNSTKM